MGMKWYQWSPRRTQHEYNSEAYNLLASAFSGMDTSDSLVLEQGFTKLDGEARKGITHVRGGIVFASQQDERTWLENKAMELDAKFDEIMDRLEEIDDGYAPRPYDQENDDFPPEAPEGWDSA